MKKHFPLGDWLGLPDGPYTKENTFHKGVQIFE